ncbi:alpha/beta fold hydrolase [Myxococcus sp. RHSTA-1-4]|uniref:alpha/beta fold hydrolase n=1 Tax=Myxococcus sp. RHSTA-1-4 TaxID=2874601 RepID=UPI001CC1A928|nr:alpha/beta fold hydrolase [Myxococcus sp. RHSTA-1-4]MBZ4422492.1 lysophospholipase [Myxococcus sp. RHSTA-1-4]
MRRSARTGLLAAGVFAVMGSGGPALAGEVAEQRARAPIEWSLCPESYAGAECATVEMPLDHHRPHGEKLPVFVARLRSGAPHAPQLWFLDGGPGGSGRMVYLGQAARLAAAMPGVDLYFPAHRGTGDSSGLTCAGELPDSPRGAELSEDEWPQCLAEVRAQWGDRLEHFNVTQAARDLGTLIERVREKDQPVFVYGLSYGTYWAWRYLELFPHQADGVIQDSVLAPGERFLSYMDAWYDDAARGYAALCGQDAACVARMGPDPWARVRAIAAKVEQGHCAEAGFTRAMLRRTLAGLFTTWRLRLFSLAIPYRLERCAPADVQALRYFASFYFEPSTDLYGFSQVLEAHIAFSELWESPAPSPATLRQRAEDALFSPDWGLERAGISTLWPKYPASRYATEWPKVKVPLLMMNGTLDPMTRYETALVAAAHYRAPDQTFVTFPHVGHSVGFNSPTTLPGSPNCGLLVAASFVSNPHAPPDTSCLEAMQPVPFENASQARRFFGRPFVSAWDNPAVP